jgi:hypothetical protein
MKVYAVMVERWDVVSVSSLYEKERDANNAVTYLMHGKRCSYSPKYWVEEMDVIMSSNHINPT